MHFVWFWTFWHWSKESFRSGALLRNPLHGIGSHWDEWYRHEASDHDRQAIAEVGRSEDTQRRFMAWLFRHWGRELGDRTNRMVPLFALGQLAQLPPFSQWSAFEKYRTSYTVTGLSALVLSETSAGEAKDVRVVEAVVLPGDSTGQVVITEGFQTEATELHAARSAAKGLLSGQGLLFFLLLWIVGGRRPYPRWLAMALAAGWLTVAGLIVLLLVGPEPGNRLFLFSLALVGLWGGLLLVGGGVVGMQSLRAWRAGATLSRRLERGQVRLRMNGGLTLKGGSAGLPFCLNTLLALYHAGPDATRGSWIWRRFFRRMHSEAGTWAGTGVVTGQGYCQPVVVEPKLRACLQHGRIRHILTPRQGEASDQTVTRLMQPGPSSVRPEPAPALFASVRRVGFAAEKVRLCVHRCFHLAQAMMALGHFADRWQVAANVFALGLSAILLTAMADLRNILLPYPTPIVVPPASSSPYYLWVSLNTQHPEYFSVLLESSYWSNRRSEVKLRGGVTPSARAEIQLHRLIGTTAANEEDGTVWIERKRRFLRREFLPGARVGRYSIAYLSHLGHE